VIEASADDLSRISTGVVARTLRIAQVSPGRSPRGPVTYRLTMRSIAGLATSSSGSIHATTVETDTLRITISSSGSVIIDSLAARTVDVIISSSGDCTLSGTVDRQTVRISSSGEYRAADLASREASVQLTSSGEATLRVAERLEARISSSGDVRYRGNPPRVTTHTSSSGRVIKLD
jgi:carbon monoxide dehydrogenase subunit G